jgi:hypothetical protein
MGTEYDLVGLCTVSSRGDGDEVAFLDFLCFAAIDRKPARD